MASDDKNNIDVSLSKDEPEFRQDIVSGDWVLIAPGRKKRPHDLASKEKTPPSPIDKCPFEDPQGSGNEVPSIIRPENNEDWRIQVIPNLYPAVLSDKKIIPSVFSDGPYFYVPGTGYHDIVITRDHYKNFPALSLSEATEVLSVMQERYKMVAEDPRVAYVSIFHNWGPTAGASLYHPHYQMISIPVIPPDVNHSLKGSERYYLENGKCAHCAIIEKESEQKKRIIFENDNAIAFLPFVSREPFEIRVFPKQHESYFEDCAENILAGVAEALQKSLTMLENKLGDVDYNFFIHTSPVKDKEKFSYYHWHIEIQPKISTLGGFELATGIEITIIDPDDGAVFLKE
jgi:UDPglucose--hexose-1-phosphate uridylyltransferase